MTAEEIRKQQFYGDDGAWECARWLQEVAAQLAELNQRLARVTHRTDEHVNTVIGIRNA